MEPNPYAPPTAIDPLPASSSTSALSQAVVIAVLTPVPALVGTGGFLLGLLVWGQLGLLGFWLSLFTAAVCGLGSAIFALQAGLWLLDREDGKKM